MMIPLAVLKNALDIEAADTSKDDILTRLEATAVSFVESRTGWHFGAVANGVIYLQGSGTRRLWLPQEAAGAVTVLERTHAGDAGTAIVETNDDGFVVRGSQIIRKNGLVWTRTNEYQVTFARGFAVGTEPEEIRQLVIDLVSAKWAQRGKEGMKSETYGGYSYTFGDGDLTTIVGAQDVIGHYRVPVIA